MAPASPTSDPARSWPGQSKEELYRLLERTPIEEIFPSESWIDLPQVALFNSIAELAVRFIELGDFDAAKELLLEPRLVPYQSSMRLITHLIDQSAREGLAPLLDYIETLRSAPPAFQELFPRIYEALPRAALPFRGPWLFFQGRFPNLSETFVLNEIAEIARRQPVVVATLLYDPEIPLPPELVGRVIQLPAGANLHDKLVWLAQFIQQHGISYLHAPWSTEAKNVMLHLVDALDLPFGFSCHAADIWQRGNRLELEELRDLGRHRRCVLAAVEGTHHRKHLIACGVPEPRIVIAPNGVQRANLPPRRTAPPERIRRLIAIGRPVAKKGFPTALDALKFLRADGLRFELELIGGGDTSTEYGAMVAKLAAQQEGVTATSLMPHRDVLARIAAADAMIMPSMVMPDGNSDGIPTVLSEAMLLGVPVITTDVASIGDLVIDGVTGFVARPGDPISLAEKIREADLLFRDREKGAALIRNARAHAARSSSRVAADRIFLHLSRMKQLLALQ